MQKFIRIPGFRASGLPDSVRFLFPIISSQASFMGLPIHSGRNESARHKEEEEGEWEEGEWEEGEWEEEEEEERKNCEIITSDGLVIR